MSVTSVGSVDANAERTTMRPATRFELSRREIHLSWGLGIPEKGEIQVCIQPRAFHGAVAASVPVHPLCCIKRATIERIRESASLWARSPTTDATASWARESPMLVEDV